MSERKHQSLVSLYWHSAAYGFVLAAIFVGSLLWMDVGGLGGLLARSGMPVFAAALLWVQSGLLFSAVQLSVSVALIPSSER
ncbi:MAG: hypothetical protein AAGL89_10180 [Pseudomonadota bacterium]